MDKVLKFNELDEIRNFSTVYARQADDYIYSMFQPRGEDLGFMAEPHRIAGLTICIVTKGALECEIDFQRVSVPQSSMLVLNSNNILCMTRCDWESTRCELLMLSPKFMHDVNINLSAIDLPSMVTERNVPVINDLSQQEAQIMTQFFNLFYANAASNTEPAFAKNIGRALVEALVYQMLQLRSNHVSRQQPATPAAPQTRRTNYVQEFMRMVQLHHTHQRSIAFYADKLFISPKYLSHIVKEATGRSASEWISDFVILEAKNMLRFSNKNVQQVAYDLNFPTQSSFGKYFKHITGMSPTEFQKT